MDHWLPVSTSEKFSRAQPSSAPCGAATSLGIALESTVNTENSEEIDTYHYIRTLLSDGVVEIEGTLKSGDELLKINNQLYMEISYIYRRKIQQFNETSLKTSSKRSRSTSFGKTTGIIHKTKTMETLHLTDNILSRTAKIGSLEIISNLALWSNSILNIELNKGDHDLGFSVHDYQNVSNPSYSPIIVIHASVPGGVAQLDGRILLGDCLTAANDTTLENMNLDDAIKILKSTPNVLLNLVIKTTIISEI